jgi:hypothetical protein
LVDRRKPVTTGAFAYLWVFVVRFTVSADFVDVPGADIPSDTFGRKHPCHRVVLAPVVDRTFGV